MKADWEKKLPFMATLIRTQKILSDLFIFLFKAVWENMGKTSSIAMYPYYVFRRKGWKQVCLSHVQD